MIRLAGQRVRPPAAVDTPPAGARRAGPQNVPPQQPPPLPPEMRLARLYASLYLPQAPAAGFSLEFAV